MWESSGMEGSDNRGTALWRGVGLDWIGLDWIGFNRFDL